MRSKICAMLGIDFPLIAFSHCRDVVAAVSRAGGFGVMGAVRFTPEQLETELKVAIITIAMFHCERIPAGRQFHRFVCSVTPVDCEDMLIVRG